MLKIAIKRAIFNHKFNIYTGNCVYKYAKLNHSLTFTQATVFINTQDSIINLTFTRATVFINKKLYKEVKT